ncbi:S27A2 synthetase, partial [Alcedo cyanopectus]|nr:S27A2 synthetase [Ceyx cyanopectus]
RRLARRPPLTLLGLFQLHARRDPRRPLLLFRDQRFTYRDAERLSNRLARALLAKLGWDGGRSVALLLPNGPLYVWCWLALGKLGRPMACLNWNVRGRALLHALGAAGARVLLAGIGELG